MVPAEGDADAAGADDFGHRGRERRVEAGDGRKVPRAAHLIPKLHVVVVVVGLGGDVSKVSDVVALLSERIGSNNFKFVKTGKEHGLFTVGRENAENSRLPYLLWRLPDSFMGLQEKAIGQIVSCMNQYCLYKPIFM